MQGHCVGSYQRVQCADPTPGAFQFISNPGIMAGTVLRIEIVQLERREHFPSAAISSSYLPLSGAPNSSSQTVMADNPTELPRSLHIPAMALQQSCLLSLPAVRRPFAPRQS